MKKLKIFFYLLVFFFLSLEGMCSSGRLPELGFEANQHRFTMKPIHQIPEEELKYLMMHTLFSPEKINNYQYFEEGKPWTEEIFKRSIHSKIIRSKEWQYDLRSFSWYVICDENHTPQGFIGGYLEPGGKYKDWLQLVYAQDTYNPAEGMMASAYYAFMKHFYPDIKAVSSAVKFQGVYTRIHPSDLSSEKFVQNLGFIQTAYNQTNNRNIWSLSTKDFLNSLKIT